MVRVGASAAAQVCPAGAGYNLRLRGKGAPRGGVDAVPPI